MYTFVCLCFVYVRMCMCMCMCTCTACAFACVCVFYVHVASVSVFAPPIMLSIVGCTRIFRQTHVRACDCILYMCIYAYIRRLPASLSLFDWLIKKKKQKQKKKSSDWLSRPMKYLGDHI